MPAPDDEEKLAEIFEEDRGGVTPVMWAALAFFGMLALAIILLVDPRGTGSAPPALQATQDQVKPGRTSAGQAETRQGETARSKSAPAETTGSAPRDEIERRWPPEKP
jgi:hypothetical protein